MIKNPSSKLFGIILVVVSVIFTVLSFFWQHDSVYIKGNSYINKRYGIIFTFPEGWFPYINHKGKTNVLAVVHKEQWNDEDASVSENQDVLFPCIVLTGYDVNKYSLKSLPEISDSILDQEFKSKGVDSYKIILKRSLGQDYQVVFDVWYAQRGHERVSGIFMKNGRNLFLLSFNDKIENFDTNIHFFNEVKNKFKFLGEKN